MLLLLAMWGGQVRGVREGVQLSSWWVEVVALQSQQAHILDLRVVLDWMVMQRRGGRRGLEAVEMGSLGPGPLGLLVGVGAAGGSVMKLTLMVARTRTEAPTKVAITTETQAPKLPTAAAATPGARAGQDSQLAAAA